jgi:hypothetical protein
LARLPTVEIIDQKRLAGLPNVIGSKTDQDQNQVYQSLLLKHLRKELIRKKILFRPKTYYSFGW